MSKIESHYDVLGVSPNATIEEIKSAYKRKCKEYHPDVGGCKHEFVKIQDAYDVLKDPEKRKRYDYSSHIVFDSPAEEQFYSLLKTVIADIGDVSFFDTSNVSKILTSIVKESIDGTKLRMRRVEEKASKNLNILDATEKRLRSKDGKWQDFLLHLIDKERQRISSIRKQTISDSNKELHTLQKMLSIAETFECFCGDEVDTTPYSKSFDMDALFAPHTWKGSDS